MKIRLLIFSILAFTILSRKDSYSQTTTAKELVLGIPSINSKNFVEIQSALTSIDGLVLLAYCDHLKLFLIAFDDQKIKSGEIIAKQIENNFPNTKTEIKIGAPISRLIKDCTAYPTKTLETKNEREQ